MLLLSIIAHSIDLLFLQSSSINLVAKVKIFIKLIMYVLSHGCLLNSYKAFFHLHTWLCMSCDFTSISYKCFFIDYAFSSWKASCYKSCFVSHDVSIYCMMELWTSSWLKGSASMMSLHSSYYSLSWNGVTCSSEQVFILLFL